MNASRILKAREASQIQEIKTPAPKGSQVLVKVESCGNCHSDLHLWEGVYQGPSGVFLRTTERGVKYLLTPLTKKIIQVYVVTSNRLINAK